MTGRGRSMAKEYTPTGFIKEKRDRWRKSPYIGKTCYYIVGDLRNGDKDLSFWRLGVPQYIPAKYHARMQSVWREILIRMAFEYANRRVSTSISYAERFKLSKRIK